jgi:predicted restriction endonuclease
MHRAFDRFLFSIDGDYRVVLSPHYREEGHPFLKVFDRPFTSASSV